jgi:hypothetical protein
MDEERHRHEVYNVIRESTSNSNWNMYIDGVLRKTSESLFQDPDSVRAGGQSDSLANGTCAITGFGYTTDWQRTDNSDNQTITWTTITSADNKIQDGLWVMGDLPDPFSVNNNPSGPC